MISRSRPLYQAAGGHGMRRILKKKDRPVDYIRKAVKSGTYRTVEEMEKIWKERAESSEDLRTVMKRFRQDIVRGSNITDYPMEYRILEQHPPIPDPPKYPRYFRRTLLPEPNPVEALVEKHYKRQQHKQRQQQDERTSELSVEEYYRRLLGVPAPSLAGASTMTSNSLALMPASLQKAYAAAVTHYKLKRTQDMTEEDALKAVDDLLKEQTDSELNASAARTKAVANRTAQDLSKVYHKDSKKRIRHRTENKDEVVTEIENDATTPKEVKDTLDGIFLGNPRAVEGMMRWSDRLKAIPYHEWTVGASTALDHWIARQILGISEEVWWSVVEGDSHLSVGKDIVLVREALFPETLEDSKFGKDGIESDDDQSSATTSGDGQQTDSSQVGRSVEELLASLSSLKVDASMENEDTPSEHSDTTSAPVSDLDQLVDQLQVWRGKQVANDYEKWSEEEQRKFDVWLQTEYIPTVLPGPKDEIDIRETRKALLKDPPIDSRSESDAFWDALEDERTAAAWLENHDASNIPAVAAPWIPDRFWKLNESEQLERLLNLGALRPLLDEYSSPSDRSTFIQQHFEDLLTGVTLEHAVPDESGTIEAAEIGEKSGKFSLVSKPFGENRDELLNAWNEQKVGRAKYEEIMFKTDRLSLNYKGDDDLKLTQNEEANYTFASAIGLGSKSKPSDVKKDSSSSDDSDLTEQEILLSRYESYGEDDDV